MPGNTLPCRSTLAAALCGAAFALVCSGAFAAPDDADDPFSRFLVEKGSTDVAVETPSGTAIAGQVRGKAADTVLAAMNFVGVPYRRGGDSDNGFDCSGFTRHIFDLSLGLALPRRVDDQATAPGLVAIKRADLRPGDLVFFNTLKRTFSHVGIYIGEGRFIHSPRSGGQVRLEDMRYAYWSKRYTGARRAESLREPEFATPSAAPMSPTANATEIARVRY